jgi:ferredoxin-fold anticodon binding domain-containing protein
MKELLQQFKGKALRIYTVSGVESYLDIVEDVKEDYVVLKGYFKGDKTYLAIDTIESFKEEPIKGAEINQ